MLRKRALLLLLLTVAPVNLTGATTPPISSTRIIKFIPSGVGMNMKEGHCWTNSIAAPRPDAWRCMVGNEIFDPCFESVDEQSLVCNPDPAKGEEGFRLKLNKPLPPPEITAEATAMGAKGGWLVELADGTLCRPATGARWLVGEKMVTYYCESNLIGKDIVLIEGLNTNEPQWLAEKATLIPEPSGPKLPKSEKVPVKTVWQ
jgi:hypothetical protein